jgi:hypothetical protein
MKIAYPHFVLADSLTQVPPELSSRWVRAVIHRTSMAGHGGLFYDHGGVHLFLVLHDAEADDAQFEVEER